MEHSIATLTPARVAKIDRKKMEELIETRPAIMRAFLWTLLADEDTLRAWIVSMGRRDSVQRVAHLMCELYVRDGHLRLRGKNRSLNPNRSAYPFAHVIDRYRCPHETNSGDSK
jgi:CRP-like cAMP-binding protein